MAAGLGGEGRVGKVKAASLWQPYPTLIALRQKHNETRSWETDYRGPLAIHATKRFPRETQELCLHNPSFSVLYEAGYKAFEKFPTGAVVAIAMLTAIYKVCEIGMLRSGPYIGDKPKRLPLPGNTERAFGDYSKGRFIWVLEHVLTLPAPIPAKGGQRLWNWSEREFVPIIGYINGEPESWGYEEQVTGIKYLHNSFGELTVIEPAGRS